MLRRSKESVSDNEEEVENDRMRRRRKEAE